MSTWTVAAMPFVVVSHDAAMHASQLGAAARSDRAEAALRVASPLTAAAVAVDEPPLALVAQESMHETAVLEGPAAAIALARRPGGRGRGSPSRGTLRGAGVSTPAVYRFLPFTRRGLVAELRDSTGCRRRAVAAPRRGQARRDPWRWPRHPHDVDPAGRSGRRRRSRPAGRWCGSRRSRTPRTSSRTTSSPSTSTNPTCRGC